jgi:hypothetical protein
MKQYRIKWQDKMNPDNCGHGDWFPESHYLILDATVDHANEKYPTIHHEIEMRDFDVTIGGVMDKPKIQYGIWGDFKFERLIETINALIKEGWRPLGGVSIAVRDGVGYLQQVEYAQAMIKEDE